MRSNSLPLRPKERSPAPGRAKRGVLSHIVCAGAIALLVVAAWKSETLFEAAAVAAWAAAFVMIQRSHVRLSWLTASLAEAPPDAASAPRRAWAPDLSLVLGLALLAVVLGALEVRQPFYFTQDDNHSQYLPIMRNALRGAFSEWRFPTWDPFVHFGHLTSTIGVYGLTYPPTYLSHLLALGLGSDLYLIDVFASLHFLAGYVVAYAMLRTAGVRPSLALAGSLSFVLSGFNLVTGRSWYNATSFVVWIPAAAWSLLVFQTAVRPSRLWVFATSATLGFAFHAGHAQLWFYLVTLWALGIAWILAARRDAFARLAPPAVAAALFGVAIASPLLVVQTLELSGLVNERMDHGIGVGLDNLLLPYPLVRSPHPNGWGVHPPQYVGAIYHSGPLFVLAFLARCACDLAYWAKRRTMPAEYLAGLSFSALAVLAFWWALGEEGGLWSWMQALPPFDEMNGPFKLLPFVAFLSIASGAPFLERVLRRFPLPRFTGAALVALTLSSVLVNAFAAKWPWMYFADTPYPEPSPAWSAAQARADGFTDGGRRVVPYAPFRSWATGFTGTLANNYPAYYRVFSTNGYCKATSLQPEHQVLDRYRSRHFRDFLTEFGVGMALVARIPPPLTQRDVRGAAVEARDAKERAILAAIPHRVVPLGRDELYVIDSPETKPLVHAEGGASPPLSFRPLPNGLEIVHDAHDAAPVIASFLHRRWFVAVDEHGRPLRIDADPLGRIRVRDTAGASRIFVLYRPPWRLGVLAGVIAAIAGAIAWRLGGRERA